MTQKKLMKMEKQVDDFNQLYPIGSDVNVKKDGGEIIQTKTTSEAYVMGEHTPVIFLEGIRGAYMLDRVTPL